VLRALRNAPMGEPLSPEDEALLAEALEDTRPPVAHAEVQSTIERMRREAEASGE